MQGLYIGLISGTSVDAIDAALVSCDGQSEKIVGTLSHAWPAQLRQDILSLCQPGDNEVDRLGVTDIDIATCFAEAANKLLKQEGCEATDIRAIGCHGQTIRHRPNARHPFTLQLGNPSHLAELTGIDVVADFRRRDMAAGGEGAPLAPAYHAHRLSDDKENRVVLNLGGIANITILPKAKDVPIVGFDTGPANTLLDAWFRQHHNLPYDADGAWAAQGRVNSELLGAMLADPYFSSPPPKSTGPEYFKLDWLREFLQHYPTLSATNVQATLLALTVETVSAAIMRYARETHRVIVCGGGAHNPKLLEKLSRKLDTMTVESSLLSGVDPDFVEATTFAWLAYQTVNHSPGNLPSVTGARHPVILGGIYPR